jgi:hypothetical protein
MKIRNLPLAAALACGVLPWAAMAQSSASAPTAAASAPLAAKPDRKPLTPQLARESATAPGDLRPEHATVPQINIPFGKTQGAAPKPQSNAPRNSNAASAGGIDDAVARCEAESDAQLRAACRIRLAHEGRTR